MKYDYVLFDLDGTLTDPAVGITESVIYALEKSGVTPPERESLYKFIGPPLMYSFREYCGMTEEEAARAVGYYRERFSSVGLFENEIYSCVGELLSRLKSDGTKIILATSKPDVYSERILEHFDIRKYFFFVAGNTLSESRPEKEDVIAYAVESCGIEDTSRAVMVGDRKYDILGGKKFGMKTVGVTYGYGGAEELCEAGADELADSVSALEKILRPHGKNAESVTM